jgi:cytochrome c oxidase subunit III
MTSTRVPNSAAGSDDDPPDHAHEHRSVWPVVSAFGATGIYVGLALVALAYSARTIPAVAGIVIAGFGIGVALFGIFGWFVQAFARYTRPPNADSDHEAHSVYVTTMILFLATDAGTFAAGFVYYAFVRVGTWPPGELPPLVSSLVVINTVILLTSSVTFHVAHRSLKRGRKRQFIALLGLTVLLGVIFLGGQLLEYYEFVVAEGFTIGDGVFASAFFGLTGLHGLHVTLGVVLLSIVFVRAHQGHYGPNRDTSVETVGLYWHFVDAVWLFLVAVLYVGATV